MSKRNKKLLSLLLSTMMVFSVVPSTVYAAPDQETEATIEQDANEEVKQEDTVNNEAMRLQTRLTQNRMRPKQMIQHRKTMKQHRKQIMQRRRLAMQHSLL